MKNKTNLEMLTLITLSLLENGIDYEVTIGSRTTVRLFSMKNGTELGVATGKCLEDALASVLGQLVSGYSGVDDRLSIL